MTPWFSFRFLPRCGLQVAVWLLALALSGASVYAHNGDDHGAAVPLVADSPRFFTTTAASEKFELVLRYEPLAAHEPAKLRLFVADFATNAPIAHARLTLTVVEDPAVRLAARETAPGDYLLIGEFPHNRLYGLTVQVVGPDGRADLLLLRPVAVGQSIPSTAGADAAAAPDAAPLPWRWVLLTVGGFAAGAGLTAFFFLRNRRRSS
jgi:hypothetical protein